MKSSLFLALGAAASLSLVACSSNTTETTTTTVPADQPTTTETTTTTTRTYTDADYHTRGDRMATRFAEANHITDEATLGKLKTAYYNRSKRYDEMMGKYQADTTGLGAARTQYNQANDQEFKSVLTAPEQYSAYQSSASTYDEANNLDITDQSAAASSATMPGNEAGSDVAKSKTKLEDGSKIKIKDGEVKTKDADGNKDVNVVSDAPLKESKTKLEDGSKLKIKDDGTIKIKDADGNKIKL